MIQSSRSNKSANKSKAAPDADIAEMKFETALAELEHLVDVMEKGHLPLDESIAAYQRGGELLRRCQRQLSDAERRVRIFEEVGLQDFDCTQEDAG